jgi:signal peptidase I
MRRGTTNVAPPLPDEVGQGPSDTGRPLTAVQDPWSGTWEAPESGDLARKHTLARKRQRLLAHKGHSAPIDLEALEALPDPDDIVVGDKGLFSKVGVVFATLASAYWYYAITIVGLAVALPLAIGWSTSTVATGSMEPVISPGDVVAFSDYDGGNLPIGSIIRFEDPARPGQTVTHRVTDINPDGTFETKGDANARPDSTCRPHRDASRRTPPGVGRVRGLDDIHHLGLDHRGGRDDRRYVRTA